MMYPSSRNIPPCPGDPRDYTLVKRGNKYYWRLNRGTIKPATLNNAMRHRNRVMKITSPFIKKVKRVLLPYIKYLQVSDLHQRLYKMAEQQVAHTGRPGLSSFNLFDLQPDHPIDHLLQAPFNVSRIEDRVQIVMLPIGEPVKKHNKDVTEFVFELILVIGDADSMWVEDQSFPIFNIKDPLLVPFVMEQVVPADKPWMLILKVSCFEGKEWARSGRHYGMKVVAAGDL
jgi:hypothetical protein